MATIPTREEIAKEILGWLVTTRRFEPEWFFGMQDLTTFTVNADHKNQRVDDAVEYVIGEEWAERRGQDFMLTRLDFRKRSQMRH